MAGADLLSNQFLQTDVAGWHLGGGERGEGRGERGEGRGERGEGRGEEGRGERGEGRGERGEGRGGTVVTLGDAPLYLHSNDGLSCVVVNGGDGRVVNPLLELFDSLLRRRGNKYDPAAKKRGLVTIETVQTSTPHVHTHAERLGNPDFP